MIFVRGQADKQYVRSEPLIFHGIIFCTAVVLNSYQIGNDVEGGYALARSVEAHLCELVQQKRRDAYTPLLRLTFVP